MQSEIWWLLLIVGGLGALVSDILKDNALELPKIKDGKFQLGFIGAVIIGAVAGYYIDGSYFTAFMGGFVGKAIIEGLVPKHIEKLIDKKKDK